MLGDSAMLGGGGGGGGEHGGSGDATPAAGTTTTNDLAAAAMSGGIGSNSGSEDVDQKGRIDEGERSFGGNRWPRQETLALLRIRSDMDVAFRDASVKGPLWEQVSRKLAELGYHRNAKKCKEKFENVYKYHKRTKDGRGGKSDGKTYRFFDQLEALDHHHQQPPPLSLPAPPQLLVTTPPMSLPINTATATSTVSVPMPMPMPPVSNITNTTISVPNVTVSSTTSLPTPPFVTNTTPPPPMNLSYPTTFQPSTNPTTTTTPFPNIPTDLLSNSSSSSTSSDETLEGTRKRKRKWKDFFEKLMKEVIEKQEELHSRFLEAIEKREHERMVREEAWRTQELQRINREREILAQERSIASAKDSAVMSFLQKIAEQQNQNLPQPFTNINIPQPVPVPPPPPQVQALPHPPPQQQPQPVTQTVTVVPQQQQVQQQQQQKQEMQVATNMEIVKADNNNSGEKENTTGASSSRWPKVEVEALIKLRTSLDSKYQENGPKGPLWEEISGGMKKLGYNRNPKRCKEKWENINKYFKKVKESNKRRPEDSKTCPYFHQLDALYREKNKHEINVVGGGVKMAESMVAPLMVQPEQQWPPQQQQQQQEGNRDHEDNDNMEEDEEEEEGTGSGSGSGSGGSNFEVVPSKPASAE